MPDNRPIRLCRNAGLDGLASLLLWLDVAPNGRILDLDPSARPFVEDVARQSDVFLIKPERAFLTALRDADHPADPVPTVLYPEGVGTRTLRQVNVLPFRPGRIRIVLFAEPHQEPPPVAPPHLTPRERAVLGLLAAGLRRDRIAWELNISLPTVDMHARNLRQKLNALTTSAAVANAARYGIIQR
ncbi:MAG: helix-turn-helix transcriptional regulator [Maritimibacter sp.]